MFEIAVCSTHTVRTNALVYANVISVLYSERSWSCLWSPMDKGWEACDIRCPGGRRTRSTYQDSTVDLTLGTSHCIA